MVSSTTQTVDVLPPPPPAPVAAPTRRHAAHRLAFLAPLWLNAALFGTVLTPLLLHSHPLLLLALIPVQPVALLAAAQLDTTPFVVTVVAARGAIYVGHYLLGRWYGTAAVRRLGQRRPAARRAERIWARIGAPVLVVSPGWWCSVLAGATGMPAWRFVPLVLTGVAVNATVTVLVAEAAESPLALASAVLHDHAVPLTVVSLVGLVLAVLVRRRFRR